MNKEKLNTVEINSTCGKILGIENEDNLEFRGIRYATAKRWEYPEQINSWSGTYDATNYGACCYQRRSFEDDATCNPFYHKEFRKGLSFTYSEDCLFLNIQTPKNPKNCPVIVYIHGGSFTGGSADEGHIDGKEFAKNGVIFVAMNYRLGPFGFCSCHELKDENGLCGNYGLYDQYIALKWIKENIESFGGDSEKITIWGQSAGAMSVDIQSSNPMAKGLFSGAVLSSGAALQRFFIKPVKAEKTVDFWKEIMKNAKVSDIEQLRRIDPKTLYYSWYNATKQVKGSMRYTLPIYDGKLLCEDNFSLKKLADIPYIIGVTTADMLPFFLETAAKKWAKKANKNNNNKAYTYLFSRDLPGDKNGAWHSSDLLYMFSTLSFNWRPFEEVDRKISKEMSDFMVAFAKSGNPNCSSLPEWKPSNKLPMIFGEKTKLGKWQTAKLIKNTLFNRGPM